MGSMIKRLLIIILAYCLASLAAGYTLVLLPAMRWLMVEVLNGRLTGPAFSNAVADFVFVGLAFSLVSGMYAALPAVFIIPLAEARRLRSATFYGAAGAGAGAASAGVLFLMRSAPISVDAILSLLFLSIWFGLNGLVGGLVYWCVTGRTAGAWRVPNAADGQALA